MYLKDLKIHEEDLHVSKNLNISKVNSIFKFYTKTTIMFGLKEY